jgi:rhodanese-related sulfurtransferase
VLTFAKSNLKVMKKSHVFTLLIVLVALFQSCNSNSQSAAAVQDIDQAELQKLAKDPNTIIIDVRTDMEVQGGYIDGTTLFFDFYGSDFKAKIGALDKSKKYIVYCHAGGRSAEAAEIMIKKGFKHVYNLEGGFSAWTGKVKR